MTVYVVVICDDGVIDAEVFEDYCTALDFVNHNDGCSRDLIFEREMEVY